MFAAVVVYALTSLSLSPDLCHLILSSAYKCSEVAYIANNIDSLKSIYFDEMNC